MRIKEVGILIFDDVEELDFVGPWEVFGMAARLEPGSVHVQLIGKDRGSVRAVYGLRTEVDVALPDAPPLDLLIVPGGRGARIAMGDDDILEFVRRTSVRGGVVGSVCTGALILGAAGLLAGKRATTHASALDDLRRFPGIHVEKQRYTDNGSILTSAGISAGIDMALYLVGRTFGEPLAERVAEAMEYRTLRDPPP